MKDSTCHQQTCWRKDLILCCYAWWHSAWQVRGDDPMVDHLGPLCPSGRRLLFHLLQHPVSTSSFLPSGS